MANELQHATVGTSLTQAEFEATSLHTADSQAQGDILYCDGTYWKRLGAGTDGQFLKTQGAAANPAWADLASYSTWAPTVTQSSQQGITVTEAQYQIVGNMCHIYAKIVINSSGTAGSAITVGGQPAAAQPALTGMTIGNGHVQDTGTANYWATLFAGAATTFQFFDTNTRAEIGANPSFALAATDVIDFNATYRVA